MSMKNIALITWASARIKMPKECELLNVGQLPVSFGGEQ